MLDIYVTLCIYFLSFFLAVPSPKVVIRRSLSGLIYAGNNFTLNADISEIPLIDSDIVSVEVSLVITWTRDGDVIRSNDHISVSSVSVSESGYTASLTYSPIAISDSGLITATLSVIPSETSSYIQSVAVSAKERLTVLGMQYYSRVVVICHKFNL